MHLFILCEEMPSKVHFLGIDIGSGCSVMDMQDFGKSLLYSFFVTFGLLPQHPTDISIIK